MANENTLDVGQSRIGLMIDGLPETPRVAVKLERTDRRIQVTVPFIEGHDDIYQYWFSSGTNYGDDPDRIKRRYEPPPTVGFHDARGDVGLVGCRDAGWRRHLGGPSIGEGLLDIDYAILGASSGMAFEKVNGLRSEIEGLGTWVGLNSLEADPKVDADGRLSSVSMELRSSTPIEVARRLNTQIQANWRYAPGPGPDQTTISERMQIQTRVKRAVDWDAHFSVHFPLRDLLRVSAWRRLNFVSHEVMSVADPMRTFDGTTHGDQWLPVLTHRTGVSESAATLSWNDFLFSFGDVGSRGVRRWLEMRSTFERGVAPLVSLLELKGAALNAQLAQVGIGFEMLGYDLMLEGGTSRSKAHKATFTEQVRTVSSAVADVLPFSVDDFPETLRRVYVGVKHADRVQPEWEDMYLATREAIQIFRAWVALRLGMPKAKLQSRLENDKLSWEIRGVLSPPSSAH